jgi:hypothetical protein
MKLEKPKEVFLQKNSYTITSYIFYTGVTVEEKQMSELTPFFSRFGPVFSSDLFGIYLLFSARRIEFDLLSLRIVFVIYIYVFNRVRVVGPDQKEAFIVVIISQSHILSKQYYSYMIPVSLCW